MSVFWFPFVHDLCTLGFFCYLYKFAFYRSKKKKKKVKPPITQVYTWRQHPLVSSPPPAALTSDPVLSDNLPIALHKGKRQCDYPISSFCSYDHLSSRSCSLIASLDSIVFPNKVFEALAHPDWRSAMIEEMDALTDNGTWDLVRLPAGCREASHWLSLGVRGEG